MARDGTLRWCSKVVGFFVILVVGWGFLISPTMMPYGGGSGQNDWQNCQIRAQRYLFDLENPQVVFVGSSKMARFRTDLLDKRFFNLSYPCIQTRGGLRIVRAKAKLPKVLFIELNSAFESERDFEAEFFDPMRLWFTRNFPMFRTEFRPALVLKKYLKGGPTKFWFLPHIIDRRTGERLTEERDLLSWEASFFQVPLTKREPLESRLQPPVPTGYNHPPEYGSNPDLKAWVDELLEKGVKVVFLEIPEMRKSQATARLLSTKQRLKQMFGDRVGFEYWEADGPDYYAPDGVHIAGDSAVYFTRKVVEKFESLNWL